CSPRIPQTLPMSGIELLSRLIAPCLFCSALVTNGASINYRLPDSGKTALAHAVVYRKLEAVRTLLALGADPNIPYKIVGLPGMRTVTPLAVARQSSPDIVNLLELAGAKD